MTSSQRARFLQTHRLPNDYLEALGRHPGRNGVIVEQLLSLPRRSSVLVFACSIEHASILTLSLNRARGGRVAALVTGKTPRSERLDVLEAFRARGSSSFATSGSSRLASTRRRSTSSV